MTPFEFATPGDTYRLIVSVEALRTLDACRSRVGKRETGGVLIGYYSEDRRIAVVTEVTPPPLDSEAGFYWFRRGIVGLRRLLMERWKAPKRRYYLGEWHYHPTAVVDPSNEDMDRMRKISDSDKYKCPEPILLIVGANTGEEWNGRAFIFPNCSRGIEFLVMNDREDI